MLLLPCKIHFVDIQVASFAVRDFAYVHQQLIINPVEEM